MIEAGLEFEGEFCPVINVFTDLPLPLRPVHFSHGEGIKIDADRIDDQKRFGAFLAKSKSGFFLLGRGVTYSVRIAAGKPIILDCFLDVSPEDADHLMRCMAKAKPIFGFACKAEELDYRNRVTTQLGANEIESWVGRDTQKYVPGLYWLTLLPEALARRHGVPLAQIQAMARQHVRLGDGQHLFRFYERPEDWKSTSSVTDLIAALPGVFDVERIKSRIASAKNLLDLDTLLDEWR